MGPGNAAVQIANILGSLFSGRHLHVSGWDAHAFSIERVDHVSTRKLPGLLTRFGHALDLAQRR